jgi:hypothetical protein
MGTRLSKATRAIYPGIFSSEASPQTHGAFAGDGHFPQGDIYSVLGKRADP